MGKFKTSLITDQGKKLLFSGSNFSYTKAVVFSQDLSGLSNDEIKALTSIDGQLLETSVGVTTGKTDNNRVDVVAIFSNEGLKADVNFKSVGWFAKNGDTEELIAVSVIDGEKTIAAQSILDGSVQTVTLTLSMAVGDSAQVQIVVDPQGMVKATDLMNAKSALEKQLTDNVNDINVKLDTKADADDVNKQLANKADKTDLEPLAKTADVNKQLDAKANADDTYNKTELDKKFLSLSTDTNGKVSADQVADLIADKADKKSVSDDIAKLQADVDTKATKADVDSEITSLTKDKANTADVNKSLDGKADKVNTYTKTEVDSKVADASNQAKKAQETADSKADKATTYTKAEVDGLTTGTITTGYDIAGTKATNEINSYNKRWLVDQGALHPFADAINNINSSRTPIVMGNDGDDLFAFRDNQIRRYPGNGLKCKNLPPASNKQWFTVQYVFENINGDGIAIFRSPNPEVWIAGNNGGKYNTGWHQLSTTDQITDLQNQINQLKEQGFQVQHFAKGQDAQASQWEAGNFGKRLAIVDD